MNTKCPNATFTRIDTDKLRDDFNDFPFVLTHLNVHLHNENIKGFLKFGIIERLLILK